MKVDNESVAQTPAPTLTRTTPASTAPERQPYGLKDGNRRHLQSEVNDLISNAATFAVSRMEIDNHVGAPVNLVLAGASSRWRSTTTISTVSRMEIDASQSVLQILHDLEAGDRQRGVHVARFDANNLYDLEDGDRRVAGRYKPAP